MVISNPTHWKEPFFNKGDKYDKIIEMIVEINANTLSRVTNGDSHNHDGGDGGQIDHVTLANKGTNTHVQIDTHVTAGAAHIAAANPHSGHVDTTGNETIDGIKTFSTIPVLPASDPTTDNQAVRKAYADKLAPGSLTRIKLTPTNGGWIGASAYQGEGVDHVGGYIDMLNANNYWGWTIDIPVGWKATHLMIYGDAGSGNQVAAFYKNINDYTATSVGTGDVNVELNITDITGTTTIMLFVRAYARSPYRIAGGYVTIERT